MGKHKDYYKVLKIEKGATKEQIHAAYLKLAKKYHPDVNKSKGAGEKFKLVAEAYEVLRDPLKRVLYEKNMGAKGITVKIINFRHIFTTLDLNLPQELEYTNAVHPIDKWLEDRIDEIIRDSDHFFSTMWYHED